MARNKYPEETYNHILDAAMKLFMTKGYDNTSIQDIQTEIGLSKGGIYHHFKSKEAILVAVYMRLSETIEEEMSAIRDDSHFTGLEKLQRMFMSSVRRSDHRDLIASTPNLLENPRLLAIQMESTIYEVGPKYIEPVIKQGIKDGSIKSDYPKQLSQVLILLSNVWMNQLIYPMDEAEANARIGFFNQLTESLGLSILDASLGRKLADMSKKTSAKKI